MHKHFSCIQGHQWQVPVDNVLALAVASISCPHCGGAAETVLPESSVLSASPPPPAPAVKAPPTMQRDEAAETMAAVPEAVAALAEFLTPPQAADELGRLGPYRILKVLGVGGMGMVFRAEDTQLRRPVALKVMQPTLAIRSDARQRFLREARAAAALKHERIVAIYQVGEDRGCPYLAMELLEGESLDLRLAREHVLPVPDVLRIGREIAEGLAAAHDKGMVHRDIKPANIWLETIADCGLRIADSGQSAIRNPQSAIDRVKILDFGLARTAEEETQLTQLGGVVGTPAYMAPEQAQAHAFDRRADLFSLGCVLYTMSTGVRPFRGQDTTSTLKALVHQEPPPPRELNPDVPEELSALIVQLLAKQPAQRPQSAQEVIAALQRMDESQSMAAPVALRSRRGVAGFVGALALLVLAVAVATYLIQVSTPEGDFYVEVDDDTVAVAVDKQGGLKLIDRSRNGKVYWIKARQTQPLPAGEYELAITDMDAGLEFNARTFTIKGKDSPASVRVWFKKANAQTKGTTKPTETVGEVRRLLHAATVTSVSFAADGQRMLSCDEKGMLHLWQVQTGEKLASWQALGEGHNPLVCCSPTAPEVAFTRVGETLAVWNISQRRVLHKCQVDGGKTAWSAGSFSADGCFIAVGGTKLWIVETTTGKEAHVHKPGRGPARSPVFCGPDRVLLAGTPYLAACTLWDWRQGKDVHELRGSSQCSTLHVSRDGKWALAGYYDDGTVRLWNMADPTRPPILFEAHAGGVYAVAISAEGERGLSVGADGLMRLHDLKSGKTVHRFDLNAGFAGKQTVKSVALAPDSRRAITGGSGRHLQLWQLPEPAAP